jgi:hypothetical protein
MKEADPMPTIFLDTETTGLHDDRRAWEISMIRRDAGAPDTTITLFIHIEDIDLAHADPTGLPVGRFHDRHPAFGAPLGPDQLYLSEATATEIVDDWTAGAEIFGVRPRFDTVTLDKALHRHGRTPRWWRDPVDITDLARGWMLARGQKPCRHSAASTFPHRSCATPPTATPNGCNAGMTHSTHPPSPTATRQAPK